MLKVQPKNDTLGSSKLPDFLAGKNANSCSIFLTEVLTIVRLPYTVQNVLSFCTPAQSGSLFRTERSSKYIYMMYAQF